MKFLSKLTTLSFQRIALTFISIIYLSFSQNALAATKKITVLAAENFYGDIAKQIGKQFIDVKSILNNPDQDPHLFEVTPSAAKNIRYAQVIIYNGLGYDTWMDKLLSTEKNASSKILVVGQLIGKKMGDNPHIWYDPNTMPTLATALAKSFSEIDPVHQADYQKNLQQFLDSLKPLQQQIQRIKTIYLGTPIVATEPVFDYMAEALGFVVLNSDFQLSVMNQTEPSAKAIASFENNIKQKKVRLLIVNEQVIDASITHLIQLSKKVGLPIVGVTETQPAHLDYQQWMLNQLQAVSKALQHSS